MRWRQRQTTLQKNQRARRNRPHVFGRGHHYLEKKAQDRKILNRDLLFEIAETHRLHITNTWFDKPDNKLASYRTPGTHNLTDINPRSYATTDHILCRNNQAHMVTDVETNTTRAFPSDHYRMTARIKVKVIRNKKKKNRLQIRKPTKEEKKAFNNHFKLTLKSSITPEHIKIAEHTDAIQTSMKSAQAATLRKKTLEINRPHIS